MRISPIRTLLSQRALAAGRKLGKAKLAGISFAQQEPDLAKEIGLTAREISGWAMGGSGTLK